MRNSFTEVCREIASLKNFKKLPVDCTPEVNNWTLKRLRFEQFRGTRNNRCFVKINQCVKKALQKNPLLYHRLPSF